MRLKAVDVGARSMRLFVDIVPGAMRKVVAVAGICDDFAGGGIDFISMHFFNMRFNEFCCLQLRFSDDLKNLFLARRGGRRCDGDARDVGIDGAGDIFFAPQVDQNPVAFLDGGAFLGAGRVVRDGGVCIDGADRLAVHDAAAVVDLLEDELLDFVLGEGMILVQLVCDEVPALLRRAV